MSSTAEVVICGAGISGIATAYHLAVTHGVKNVVIVDERPPLSLTSDKSSEAYRNWWPDEMMVRLMNRSIDWLERWALESNNRFLLNRRGYLYFTANLNSVPDFQRAARTAAQAGAGEVRVHADRSNDAAYAPVDPHRFVDQPAGSDLLLDRSLILDRFPCVNPDVVAAAACAPLWLVQRPAVGHVSAGASARARRHADPRSDRSGAREEQSGGGDSSCLRRSISTRSFINAAGPFVNRSDNSSAWIYRHP